MSKPKSGPSDEQRRTVKKLAGFGLTQQQICAVVGIKSPRILRKHFRQELILGPVETKTRVMGTAFRLARSGRDPAMTIFWLKTRGRWSETNGLPEPVERSSEPIQFVVTTYQPPRSPEDEMAIQTAIAQLQGGDATRSEWEGDQVHAGDPD
jgi:hypothetical protein